ncbi:MAG: DNA mismatch repair endonuclease MutL [Bacteroidales bacterium]|jgi:DNA mismatch repair protein MutL|nr:DNA mismatch repair endonuclease MutL [Bacteroidales bacterium]
MSDIIRLLPDSVSNQIAAGEVIQRPASVVKELVENAIDASATEIQVVIKDAGRTLIQIIDNGKGMSETDARMAFERHATSKITSANDIFSLKTMGFRGEALASIAAVAQVELCTQQANADLGTRICIAGSVVEKQEAFCGLTGSNFMVKNLFFNVPARRRFLKKPELEFLHIISEFQRVALVNPDIHFTLTHNEVEIYKLPPTNIKQRIIRVFSKNNQQQRQVNQLLLNIDVETSLAKITGFIGRPEMTKKRNDQQFFFVNGRYMRHPYFHKAVMHAYDSLIPSGEMPSYFIYFTVNPAEIDINIHPTKTEIKFENEQALWSIISAAVKESLGKFVAAPMIDFDREDAPDIPPLGASGEIKAPEFAVNSSYNPFKTTSGSSGYKQPSLATNWDKLYDGFEHERNLPASESTDAQPQLFESIPAASTEFASERKEPATQNLQLKGKYILTSVKSGLMLIDQHRAHVKVLYEQYMTQLHQKKSASQRMLFPEIVEFSQEEATVLPLLLDDLHYIGFELDKMDNHTYAINGTPVNSCEMNPTEIIKDIIFSVRERGTDIKEQVVETIALSLAKKTAIPYGKSLSDEETQHVINQLFTSNAPNYTPDGKAIIHIVPNEEIDKWFSN